MAEDHDKQRYERKFYLPVLLRNEFELIIKHHPFRFHEVYPQRFVNNIYLDTINMDNYFDNIYGVSRRLKVRIRWYGDLMGSIEKPKLEIKKKNNSLGTKLSFQLNKLTISNKLSKSTISNIFETSETPANMIPYLKSLNLVLMNRYSRKYYRSGDGKYRITIDSNLGYYKLLQLNNNFSHKIIDKNATIIELKYDKDSDDRAKNVTNYFPFRITKSSKYIEGVDRLKI